MLAAAWVTDRLGGTRRAGEAQAIVGTSLVFGSALGPYLSSFCVDTLGYRGLFGLLAVVGAAGTLLVLFAVPESLPAPPMRRAERAAGGSPSCADLALARRESEA